MGYETDFGNGDRGGFDAYCRNDGQDGECLMPVRRGKGGGLIVKIVAQRIEAQFVVALEQLLACEAGSADKFLIG